MDEERGRWKLSDGEPSTTRGFRAESMQVDCATVASLHGDLDAECAPALTRHLLDLMTEPIESLTLDLAGVTFMDSAGLGVLAIVSKRAKQGGVRFAVCDVPPVVDRLFQVVGMTTVFDIVDRDATIARTDDEH